MRQHREKQRLAAREKLPRSSTQQRQQQQEHRKRKSDGSRESDEEFSPTATGEAEALSGLSFVHTRKRSKDTPIVFLTAIFRDEAHVFQAYSAGAVDVVFKPVDPFILKSKVTVLVDLYLKTEEVKRQSAYQQWLLDEHDRVKAKAAVTEKALRRTEARQEAILRSLPIVFTSRSIEPPFAPQFVSDSIFGLSLIHI